MRARGPRPYEVVIRVWARPVRRGGVSPPDIHVLRARRPRPYENVRGAINCATTNAFFVNEKLLFRNGISMRARGPRPEREPLIGRGDPAPTSDL